MRGTGIFTGITSSPSHSLRQSRSRYAIRAGRNLPDKEFRYLRTVIVTAAVHRGFGFFDFAETCVFVKQSLRAIRCGSLGLLTPYRSTPSPEVTELICRVPERVFSRAPVDTLLVYLCRFAVRMRQRLLRGFSRRPGISDFVALRPRHRLHG